YDELATAEVEHKHAVENAVLARESLAFDLRTARLEADRQQLVVNNLERRARELSVISPVDGMVGNVAVDQRASVAANTPLLTVVDLTALEIEAQIPESYADSLGLGMPAEIRYGNSTYPGIVTAISPEVNDAQVTTRVRFADAVPGRPATEPARLGARGDGNQGERAHGAARPLPRIRFRPHGLRGARRTCDAHAHPGGLQQREPRRDHRRPGGRRSHRDFQDRKSVV